MLLRVELASIDCYVWIAIAEGPYAGNLPEVLL